MSNKPLSAEEKLYELKQKHTKAVGCSLEEIEFLENKYQVKLPYFYKVFLEYFGKDASTYNVGSDFTYKWLIDMQEHADELLEENRLPCLDNNSFVFFMHQGYQFCFFNCDETTDDPIVYYFNECFKDVRVVELTGTLVDFICNPELSFSKLTKEDYI